MVKSNFKHISKNNKDSTGFFQRIKNFFTDSNLGLRIFTALVMFTVAFGVFSLGYISVCSFAIALAVVMVYEYDRMFIAPLPSDPNIKGRVPTPKSVLYFREKFSVDAFVIAGLLFLYCRDFINGFNIFSALYVFIIYFIVSLFISRANKREHWFLESLPPLYIGLGVFSLLISYISYSWIAVLFFFVITIATDSGAYFVGTLLRGPKLCPRISPKKTWSGFIGGILSAIIFVKLFFFVLPESLDSSKLISYLSSVLTIVILSILAQLGDLFESHLKRTAGVKDSSQFIPGHGGFLDRFDSIIFIFDIIAIVGFVYMLHIQN